MIKNNMKKIIANKFLYARKMADLKQEDAAIKMGFNDRQTISYIESGKRQLSADELLRACTIFNKNIDFFTDPYISNEKITWRAPINNKDLEKIEYYVNKIIAANIHFSKILGESFYPLQVNIPKCNLSSYEKVSEVAEDLVEKLNFGEYPANNLYDKVQEKFNIDILHIDCPHDISGGACKTDKINFIFVNRNDIFYRRNFTIGHELFHILTWDILKPDHIDPINQTKSRKEKRETLADLFTSSFLMPKKTVFKLWKSIGSKNIYDWILDTAEKFEVSGEALFWRMVNLKLIEKPIYNKSKLSNRSHNKKKINLFNKRFVNKIYNVLENGLVSLKKVIEIINMPPEEIDKMMSSYNYSLSYEI